MGAYGGSAGWERTGAPPSKSPPQDGGMGGYGGSAGWERTGAPPSKSPPKMGGDFQSCVAHGFLPAQE